MSIIPIDSAAPQKRREKIQNKRRHSRTNSRTKNDVIEEDFMTLNTTLEDSSRTLAGYGSTYQPDEKHAVPVTSIPSRYRAPVNESQPSSDEIYQKNTQVEAADGFEYYDPLCGLDSTFDETGNEYFALYQQMHLMQPQIASAQRGHVDMIKIQRSSQLGLLKPEDEESEASTAIASNASTPLLLTDFSFGHSSMASGEETVFEFKPEIAIDMDLPVGCFPTVGNWFAPDCPSAFAAASIMDQIYAESSQLRQAESHTWFGQCSASGSEEKNGDCTNIFLVPSLFDLPENKDHQGQNQAAKILSDSCLDLAEYGTVDPIILPSAQGALFRKNGQKRPFSEDDQGDGGEHADLLSERPLSESGEAKPLACPFYKRDPKQHQVCGKYKLRRIKDVKQHIYRLHYNPELYCPRCRLKFECFSKRDHHI